MEAFHVKNTRLNSGKKHYIGESNGKSNGGYIDESNGSRNDRNARLNVLNVHISFDKCEEQEENPMALSNIAQDEWRSSSYCEVNFAGDRSQKMENGKW